MDVLGPTLVKSVDDINAGVCHVLITEFSYRGHNKSRAIDPLDPKRLEFRFEVFELACMPSVLAQTSKEFSWVIVIDRALSAENRKRILSSARHQRIHLHEFSEDDDLAGSEWLKPYAKTNVDYLVTTILDDDDTLPTNFVESVQRICGTMRPSIPPLFTLGYKSSLQWDLVVSRRAPLGYKSSWNRGNWCRAAGFSMLTRMIDDLSVMALPHIVGDAWFETARSEDLRRRLSEKWNCEIPTDSVSWIEETIDRFKTRAGIPYDLVCKSNHRGESSLFIDLSGATGPIIMTNHFFNDMVFRLLEPKSDRLRVKGRSCFPNTVVRLQRLEQRAKAFRKTWQLFFQLLNQREKNMTDETARSSRIRLVFWSLWRFILI